MSALTCWPPPIADTERPAQHCDHCGGWVRFYEGECRYCKGGTLSLPVLWSLLHSDRRDAFLTYHGLQAPTHNELVASYANRTQTLISAAEPENTKSR